MQTSNDNRLHDQSEEAREDFLHSLNVELSGAPLLARPLERNVGP
jgi:hypothetical protein